MVFFSLVGSTGVGKTAFALQVALYLVEQKKCAGVDLISADSKQVYQGLEVVTGADIPSQFIRQVHPDLPYPAYFQNKIGLHGISIISPDQEWSVAHFQTMALKVIDQAQAKQRLVLMVGGTGLYHQQLLNFSPNLKVGPDKQLRQRAEQLSLLELQAWTKKVNPVRFSQMNCSDRHNPRRLVRVIEIGLVGQSQKKPPNLQMRHLYLGLKRDSIAIEEKIKLRVKKRFTTGAIEEVKKILQLKLPVDSPVLGTLGVPEIGAYLNHQLSKTECLELWALHEFQYAKRQLTWWKNKNLRWFELSDPRWQESAFAYILRSCSNLSKKIK